MNLMVYLNGNFVKAEEAKVSVYDHGYLYGDGVFETLKAYKKHVFEFERHIKRLHNSLKQMHMDLPMPPNTMLKTIKLLLQYNHLTDAYIRITISRGEGPIGLDISLCPQPSLFIVAEPPHSYPASWYQEGIGAVVVPTRKIPDACMPSSIKSCNYAVNMLARKQASDRGAREAVMLNMEGYVTEGTVSNIFIIKDGDIITPALSSGILNGVTRDVVIELAERRNLETAERYVLPSEILSADECFLTNTSMEIMPVTACDEKQIGEGAPGKITRVLMKDFKRYVEDCIKTE